VDTRAAGIYVVAERDLLFSTVVFSVVVVEEGSS
jgi:hypothetical protein